MKLLAFLLFFFALSNSVFAGLPSREVSKGNKAAQNGQFDEAQYNYIKALEDKADSSIVFYNLGNAMYDAGEYDRAMKLYVGAIDSTRTKEQLNSAFFNMGNAAASKRKSSSKPSRPTSRRCEMIPKTWILSRTLNSLCA
jgi:tetratricopeptide (TPR) repeat protein